MALWHLFVVAFASLPACLTLPSAQHHTLGTNDDGTALLNKTTSVDQSDMDSALSQQPKKLETFSVRRDYLRHGSNNGSETTVVATNTDSTSKLRMRDIEDRLHITGYFGVVDSSIPNATLRSISDVSGNDIVNLGQEAATSAQKIIDTSGYTSETSNFYNITVGPYSLIAVPYGAAAEGDRFNWGDYQYIANYVKNQTQAQLTEKRAVVGVITNDAGQAYVDWAVTWSWWNVPLPAPAGDTAQAQGTGVTNEGGGRRLMRKDMTGGTTGGGLPVTGQNGGGLPDGIMIPVRGTPFVWIIADGAARISAMVLHSLLYNSLGDMRFDHANSLLIDKPYVGFHASYDWTSSGAISKAIGEAGVNFAMLKYNDPSAPIAQRALTTTMMMNVFQTLMAWMEEPGRHYSTSFKKIHTLVGELWYVGYEGSSRVASFSLGDQMRLPVGSQKMLGDVGDMAAKAAGGVTRIFWRATDEL